MADLSRLDARVSQQDRVTNNRDGVLPGRRNTEAPRLEVNADLRSARRGDGGAEELLRVLGGVSRSLAAVQQTAMQTAEQRYEREARQDVDQARADTVSGSFDEKRMAASTAYRKWRIKGALDADLVTVDSAIRDEIETFTASDEDGLWTTEDIDGIIKKHFKSLVTDENGKPKGGYLDSPEAREMITKRLNDIRPKYLTEAHEFMVKQTRERDLNKAVQGFIGSVEKGGAYDLDGFVKSLPPQINRPDALEAAMVGIMSHAEATENVEGLQKLLNGTKADGKTPLLGYKDQARLLEAVPKIERQREARLDKERDERHEANTMQLDEMFVQGKPPSISTIRQWVSEDRIDARTGRVFINSIESDARERRSEARAVAAEARAAYQSNVELNVSALSIEWQSGIGPLTQREFGETVDRLNRQGALGTGKQLASNLLQLNAAWKSGRTAVAASPTYKAFAKQVSDTFSGKGGLVAGARGNTSPAVGAAALEHYNALVMVGKRTPPAAFQETMKAYSAYASGRGQRAAGPSGGGDAAALNARIAELEAKRDH